MKVVATRNYYDRELNEEKKKGDKYEVDDTRGKVLISAKVAKEIKRQSGKNDDKATDKQESGK